VLRGKIPQDCNHKKMCQDFIRTSSPITATNFPTFCNLEFLLLAIALIEIKKENTFKSTELTILYSSSVAINNLLMMPFTSGLASSLKT
jgi:hypothetical protein